ncbi:MAG: PKD domain-containing protein [Candidatus Aminicenantes bacterium]|nr:PKD domain-containing protein [Candidatus Aminicenantes bacterium]
MKKIYIPVIIILLLFHCWCKKVPFYAGEGATLTISADHTQLKTGGDRTRLTIMGFDGQGQALHDHTRVVFSATLGTMAPTDVELMAGSGAAEFISGDRGGVAEIRARSGNIKAEPDPLQITIGAAALGSLSLSANPSRFDPGGGRSLIRAYAFDADGNLLEGIALALSSTSGYFENAAPLYTTNAEGMVEDFLHLTETATVKAASGEKNAEVEITVAAETENQLPQSEFSYSPAPPARGETVNFNGSLSSDPDGSIVSWQWDFGDGQMGAGERVTHVFTWDGNNTRTFTVLLRVTDNRNGVSVTGKSITVETEEENQRPTADFTYSPSSPLKKERIYFNGSLSWDADGTITSWQWDFGDGRKAEGQTTRHVYNWSNDEDRTFTVTLTATDDGGAEGVTTKTVTVRGLIVNSEFP